MTFSICLKKGSKLLLDIEFGNDMTFFTTIG